MNCFHSDILGFSVNVPMHIVKSYFRYGRNERGVFRNRLLLYCYNLKNYINLIDLLEIHIKITINFLIFGLAFDNINSGTDNL